MIVVTATLVFVTLIFAPIKVQIDMSLYPQDLCAHAKLKLGAIPILNEKFVLKSGALDCSGTISTRVELQKMDKKSGVDIVKCLTVDRVCVALYNNVATVSTLFVAIQNAILAIATEVICALSHCQLYSTLCLTQAQSRIVLRLVVSVSVAELSFCLLKQGVRKWKTRRSKR